EKCSFDDPVYRKACILKHAQRLFRDSSHKSKNKYFDDPKLKTNEECLKNKPSNIDPKFQRNKACANRSLQKMTHYNGTKSFARLKQETDVMKKLNEQREQGLNEKTDEQIFQDVLGKDTHGYLRDYGPRKSIIKHFQNTRKEAEDARKEAEEARKDAKLAKNEVERTRSEVDLKISANNKVWEKKLKRMLQAFRVGNFENNDSFSDGSSA
ncbi:putative DNA-3-methyladenine glycosylase YfjP, partial [Bienertia sinuspersici]